MAPYEMQVWLGLFIAASLQQGRGTAALWETYSEGFLPAPNFGRYMSKSRFDLICRHLYVADVRDINVSEDSWFLIREFVLAFNKNRTTNVSPGTYLNVDELMSAYQPRTSLHAPHLSFVKGKPEENGFEIKNVCDGDSGVMLHLEVGYIPIRVD